MSAKNLLLNFSTPEILEAFLAGTSDAFIVLDAHGNTITCNDKYKSFHYKYVDSALYTGLDYRKVITDSALACMLHHLHKSHAGETVKCTEKFLVNGKAEWYDFEFHPLKNEQGITEGTGIGVFDTTEKNAAIEKLQQSEELFKALVQNSTDVFQLTDHQLHTRYVSNAVTNVLGYTPCQLQGISLLDFIHPDDVNAINHWLNILQQQPGVTHRVEARVKNSHDDWIYIEVNGRNMIGVDHIDAIVINYRDIQLKKMADNALALAEQRMSLLLNNTKESFIVVDSKLCVLTYNKAAQEHMGNFFTKDIQSGISILELVAQDRIEEMMTIFAHVFARKEVTMETDFTDELGDLHVYSHVYRPLITGEEIQGIFITSTNITERKLAEQKVKASEEKYRTIIQESFDAMLINDEQSHIIDASPAIAKVLGFTPEELYGNSIFSLVHEDYHALVNAKLNDVLEAPGRERSIDLRMRHRMGNHVWVEMKTRNMLHNKHIKGLIVLMRDISERKKAEEIISLSEQRFKGLVQSGADMISIIDEEGFVKYSSPTVINVLGNDPIKDIGKNVFAYIHPDDLEWTKQTFTNMLQTGVRKMNFGPYRFPNAKGEYRWLETVVTNLYDDPAVRGIVINSRDVTENKKLNEEQQALTEELMKNNKDLQQFSFITSHNLRAPVANLMGLLSLYDKTNTDIDFNGVLIEKFEESVQQLNSTLNDLLEILVLRSNTNQEKEILSFTEIYHSACKSIELQLNEQNGNLQADFSVVDTVAYNKVHLESIFLNLISNAIKYRHTERQLQINIRSMQQDHWTVVLFEDNGIGIDIERYKDRMFGMYQRFHAGREGKGLGLYMIKSQIHSMGGKIEVESVPGEGSIFKVYFKTDGQV